MTKPITKELILARPVIQFLVSPFWDTFEGELQDVMWDTSEARVVIGTLGTGTGTVAAAFPENYNTCEIPK